MARSDVVFGVARANAPPRRPVAEDEPVLFVLPEGALSADGKTIATTYAQASMVHYELGQKLARMMRVRGSATPPGGDIGGTPVAMRVAA